MPGPETGVSARSQDRRHGERDHGCRCGREPGDDEDAPAAADLDRAGDRGQQGRREGRVGGRVLEDGGVDEVEQPGHPGEGADRARALVAGVEVSLEVEALRGAEGTEHVGRVVVRVGAARRGAHADTPISSSASLSARSA